MLVFGSDIRSEDDIRRRLEEWGIPDSDASLPSGCDRFRRVYFLYDLMNLSDYVDLLEPYDLYVGKGNKIDIARSIVEHTNLALPDFVQVMDLSDIRLRQYFSMVYDIDDEDLDLKEGEFKTLLRSRMEKLDQGRKHKVWWDSDHWTARPTARSDGTPCDSWWEVEVHDFLVERGYGPFKPTSASQGEYYEDSAMYPDWIVDGKMIELFGAEYFDGYPEKTDLKKRTHVLPLIAISPREYKGGRWKRKLERELGEP